MASITEEFDVPTVGLAFKSHSEVENYVKNYGASVRQLFIRNRSSRLTPDYQRPGNERLFYFHVEYGCKYGGSYRSKSSGQRSTSTYKIECEAVIVFHISKDKQHLEIKRVNLSHQNHDDATAFYELLPEVRRLEPDQRDKVVELLKLRCNQKIVRAKLEKEYEKKVTMKDLSNIKTTLRQKDDFAKMVERLQQKGAATRILTTDGQFKGLYFSTPDMRNSMKAWPKVIFIDGTYKLLRINLTVMIFLVEDSNASSEIVGVALLAREDYVTFKWLLETFKTENSSACPEINCIMSDKDLLERDVLREIFPNVPIYICLFHTLKTFSREISREKMNVSAEERNKCLKILEMLAYSSSEEKYNEQYAKLQKIAPKSVLSYFDKNWHGIKEEWTCYSMVSGNLHNRTNNRLESINAKIKQIIEKSSSLIDFVDSFFAFLESHEHQVNLKTSKSFTRRSTVLYPTDSAERKYMEILTREGFTYVLAEIIACNEIKIVKKSNQTYVVETGNSTVHVTLSSCDCGIAKSSLLPCRHIFAMRKYCSVSLFSEELCDKHWTKAYCIENQRSFKVARDQSDMAHQSPVVTNLHCEEILTDKTRKKLLVSITNDLKTTCSQSCGSDFNRRFDIMKRIEIFWTKGSHFTVRHVVGITKNLTENDLGRQNRSRKKQTVPEKRKLIEPVTNSLVQLGLKYSGAEFRTKLSSLKEIESFWRRQLPVLVEEISDVQEEFLPDKLPYGKNSANESTTLVENQDPLVVHEEMVKRFQRLLNINATSHDLSQIEIPEAAKIRGRPSRNLDTWVNTKSRKFAKK